MLLGGTMNEERRRILEMLSAGKITTEEADRLLAALGSQQVSGLATSCETVAKAPPKYLRVLVEERSERSGDGHTQVNIRVPMQLLRAGVRLAGLIPAQAQVRVNEALQDQGINFDLSHLKPENLEELVNQLSDLTVDVDDRDTKVRVFCE